MEKISKEERERKWKERCGVPSTCGGVGTGACKGLAGYNYAASTCSTWAIAVATKEKVNSWLNFNSFETVYYLRT